MTKTVPFPAFHFDFSRCSAEVQTRLQKKPRRDLKNILENVWCVSCRSSTTMLDYSGKTDKSGVTLLGKCTYCGGEVARHIEQQ